MRPREGKRRLLLGGEAWRPVRLLSSAEADHSSLNRLLHFKLRRQETHGARSATGRDVRLSATHYRCRHRQKYTTGPAALWMSLPRTGRCEPNRQAARPKRRPVVHEKSRRRNSACEPQKTLRFTGDGTQRAGCDSQSGPTHVLVSSRSEKLREIIPSRPRYANLWNADRCSDTPKVVIVASGRLQGCKNDNLRQGSPHARTGSIDRVGGSLPRPWLIRIPGSTAPTTRSASIPDPRKL